MSVSLPGSLPAFKIDPPTCQATFYAQNFPETEIFKKAVTCPQASFGEMRVSHKLLIENLFTRLEEYRRLQTLAKMQDPGLCCSLFLPLEIAKLLVDSKGEFKKEIIPHILKGLQKKFAPESIPSFAGYLSKTLTMLLDNNNDITRVILSLFEQTLPPSNNNEQFQSVRKHLIGPTLQQDPIREVSKQEARVVFLNHILTEPRQGPSGPCCADWLSIMQKNDLAAKNINEILSIGHFFWTLYKADTRLDFNLSINSASLTRQIHIDKDGKILQDSDHLNEAIAFDEAPGIRAALIQMGIELSDSIVKERVLAKLKPQKGKSPSICAKDIIEAYAQAWHWEDCSRDSARLANQGIHGFLALECCLSQRAVTLATAAAFQQFPSSTITDQILNCVQEAFACQESTEKNSQSLFMNGIKWLTTSSATLSDLKKASDVARRIFVNTLERQIAFQFEVKAGSDPAILGHFSLYRKNIDSSSQEAEQKKKIENSVQFQFFIKNVILESRQACLTNLRDKELKGHASIFFEKMSLQAATKEFITTCIQNFSQKNPGSLPWSIKAYGDSFLTNVDRLNIAATSHLVKITPSVVYPDFTDWYFKTVLQESENQGLEYCFGSCEAPGARHDFNWMLKHSSVAKICQAARESNTNLEIALDQTLAVPGRNLAELIANREVIIESVVSIILEADKKTIAPFSDDFFSDSLDPTESLFTYLQRCRKTAALKALSQGKEALRNEFNSLSSLINISSCSQTSIFNLSSVLIDRLNKKFNPEKNQMLTELYTGFVTQAVLRALPYEDYSKVAEKALHIAHLNQQEFHLWPANLHLCLFFNPATRKYAFGTIEENNENLNPQPLLHCHFLASREDIFSIR